MDVEEVLRVYSQGFGNLRENELRKVVRVLENVWEAEANQKLRVFTGINLSLCYFKLNNPMKALEVLGDLVNRVDEPFMKASVLFNLAAIKCSLGFLDEALGLDLKIVKILKGVDDGLNCATVKVSVYRNIAIICKQLGQFEQAFKYDSQARSLAMKFLGPSNLLTISLERNKLFHLSEVFKPTPLPSKSFLKALRFVSGERLQPMHNKRTPWTKRLKSLCGSTETPNKDPLIRPEYILPNTTNTKFSKISGMVDEIKRGILEKRNESQEKCEKINEKGATEGLTNKKHKKIKIVCLRDIKLNKKRNRAAVFIQKWFRGYSCRRKLFFSEVRDRVELRIECLDMFNDDTRVVDKVSEENEKKLEENEISDEEYSEHFEENENQKKTIPIIKEETEDTINIMPIIKQNSTKTLKKSEESNKNLLELQERSAKIIQFHFRNHVFELSLGNSTPGILTSILLIQNFFRSYYQRKTQSAIKIQKTFKMHKSRIYFKSARSAIILIQKWYRHQKSFQ